MKKGFFAAVYNEFKMPEDEIRPDEISADDISWKF